MSDYIDSLMRQIVSRDDLLEEIEEFFTGQLSPYEEIDLLRYVRKGAGRDLFIELWNANKHRDQVDADGLGLLLEILINLARAKLSSPSELDAIAADASTPAWISRQAIAFAHGMRSGTYVPSDSQYSFFGRALRDSKMRVSESFASWMTVSNKFKEVEKGHDLPPELAWESRLSDRLNVLAVHRDVYLSKTDSWIRMDARAKQQLDGVRLDVSMLPGSAGANLTIHCPWVKMHAVMAIQFEQRKGATDGLMPVTYLESVAEGELSGVLPSDAMLILRHQRIHRSLLLLANPLYDNE